MEQKEKYEKYEQFKVQTRLPTFAIPKHYDLKLKIDLSACTFEGIVDISLNIVEETSFLVLNVLELTVGDAVFKGSDQQEVYPSDVVVDNDDEILVLIFNSALAVGEAILRIKFSGVLNEHMKGLYRSTYVVGEEKKNMAVTQFAAVDTRRCFPCWDEPALKATFKVIVEEVPSELIALSNMPVIEEKVNGDFKTVYFEKSPVMSCYLVALVVGVFDHIEDTTSDGTKVRVYCPFGKIQSGRFALKVAINSLEIYKNFFSMPYPLPKLDLAAVPDFAAGAMENYGLIIYRETELLCDEFHSAASNKQRVAVVTAHEVAHMWFGDLVTMEWWTDIWLNEGFATWVSYLAVDTLFPEWKMRNQFLDETADGLRLDALEESHPIEVEVSHPRSLDEIFDAISYNKGSAVIQMLQGYLGNDIFQRSLASYMKRYAWKNTKTKDLWDVLSEESGIHVNKLMNTWTKQKGYPVLYVKREDHMLEFEQSQFLSSGSHGDGQWIIPITICFGSYDKRKNLLLETKFGKMDISDISLLDDHSSSAENVRHENVDEQIWIKVNVEQTGFYRVRYDEILATQLKKAIKAGYLSPSDRFGILDDSHALCQACELPLSALLSLMDAYAKELDYIVLSKLIEICDTIAKISRDALPNSFAKLISFFKNILSFPATKLGWDLVSGETHLNSLLRGEVLTALAKFGHQETQNEATKRFLAFLEDKNTSLLPPDLRRVAYVAVMRNASATSRSRFESLLNVYREVDVGQEKARILRVMAYSPDPNLVLKALNFFLSSEVRSQDIVYGLAGISFEGREVAWLWLKENWDLIWKKWGSSLVITRFIRDIVSLFSSEEMAEEVEAFFETRINPSIARNLKQSIEQIRIKARWIQNIKNETGLAELVEKLAQ